MSWNKNSRRVAGAKNDQNRAVKITQKLIIEQSRVIDQILAKYQKFQIFFQNFIQFRVRGTSIFINIYINIRGQKLCNSKYI